MNETQSALWMKLASFEIDEPNQLLSFHRKLSRETGWDLSFTLRVIEEYRRFLFLCAASGHPCSPSDQVDQAWHLHLTYTRSYWERLCGGVLPAPLHHEPSKGGAQESAKFEDWYERTLESYRKFFESEPPLDIWPPTHLRLVKPLPERHTEDAWIIPKARTKRAFSVIGAGAVLAGVAGCSGGAAIALAIGPLLVSGFVLLIVLGIAASINQDPASRKARERNQNNGSSSGSSGCSSTSGGSDSGGGDSSGCGGGCGGCGGGD